jgi:hypothetical protein
LFKRQETAERERERERGGKKRRGSVVTDTSYTQVWRGRERASLCQKVPKLRPLVLLVEMV